MFFPCGVGHMMGLDVHDMEDLGEVWVGYDGEAKSTQFGLKSLRLARTLEPGFVVTVEPGIYFIPQLMDLWRSAGPLCGVPRLRSLSTAGATSAASATRRTTSSPPTAPAVSVPQSPCRWPRCSFYGADHPSRTR